MATQGASRQPGDTGALVRPRSIAAIGGGAAAEVIRQCRRMGYEGSIYPVHPRHDEIEGLRCYATLADLPAPPDAAFVGVNRHASVDVVRELAAMGAGGAVCFASGFRESGGDGGALQDALVAAAGDMPMLGPNTYGLINYLDGALLWPDQHGGPRRESGVALLTQSSNIAINLTMNRRGLPVAYVVTLGNQAQTGMSEMIRAVASDPRVTAVGLLVEGFDDSAAFAAAVRQAQGRGVPVVVLKAGTSSAGADLAFSHTASLGGGAERVAALFDRLGVGRVDSLPALLETLKLLHAGGPLAGSNAVSLSCSGGEAILMADAGNRDGVSFPAFSAERHCAIESTVSDLVTVSNPFDYHMFMWGNQPAMAATFSEVMQADVDITCLVLDLPRGDRCDDALWRPSMEALIDAHARTGARAALVATMAEGLPEGDAERCMAAGVVPFVGVDDAMTAIRVAANVSAHAAADPWLPQGPCLRSGSPATRTEVDAKQRLACYGVPRPAGEAVTAGDREAAVACAERIGYPVVAKAVAVELAHKSEAGGVALDLGSAADVRTAVERLRALGSQVLVEEMVSDGVAELLVGYQHDPVLGGFLTVASGGILVELVGDSRLLPLPVTTGDIRAAIDGLRVARLLAGHRGQPAGDDEALVSAIAAIGAFCHAHAERLVELDVNPLIVRPRGHGVVAADALIRMLDGSAAAERSRVP